MISLAGINCRFVDCSSLNKVEKVCDWLLVPVNPELKALIDLGECECDV